MRDNLGLTKAQGFSPERMLMFEKIIDYIASTYKEQNYPVPPDELVHMGIIPGEADLWKTVEKAIEFYAIPKGICVTQCIDQNAFYLIETPKQYAEYCRESAELVEDFQRRKNMLTAAWMGHKNKD